MRTLIFSENINQTFHHPASICPVKPIHFLLLRKKTNQEIVHPKKKKKNVFILKHVFT